MRVSDHDYGLLCIWHNICCRSFLFRQKCRHVTRKALLDIKSIFHSIPLAISHFSAYFPLLSSLIHNNFFHSISPFFFVLLLHHLFHLFNSIVCYLKYFIAWFIYCIMMSDLNIKMVWIMFLAVASSTAHNILLFCCFWFCHSILLLFYDEKCVNLMQNFDISFNNFSMVWYK